MGDGRHGERHSHQFAFGVLYQGNKLQVQQAQVGIHITVNHLRRKDRKVIEVAVGTVDEVEDFLTIVLLSHFPFGNLAYVETITLLKHPGSAYHLVRNGVGDEDAQLQPVIGLLEAQGLEVFSVIWIVILKGKRRNIVESFHHTAFIVEIREAQRTADGGHAILLAKGDDGLDEGLGHLLVVNKVHPPETHFLVLPVPVGNLVDDSNDAPRHFPVLVGQEHLGLGILAHGVLGHIQGGHLVHEDIGDIVGAVLVQLKGEFDESLEVGL